MPSLRIYPGQSVLCIQLQPMKSLFRLGDFNRAVERHFDGKVSGCMWIQYSPNIGERKKRVKRII